MRSEPVQPQLLDAVKLSALKLKEKQSALDTRAKELDALKAKLESGRTEVEGRAAKLTAEREAFERERTGLEDVRRSMERDLAAIDDGRTKLAKDEGLFQQALEALEERERAIRAEEERVSQLEQGFSGQMADSEARLRGLLEREEALVKLQTNWLAAFEGREKELHTIGEEMRAQQGELAHQEESLSALKDAIKDELSRLLGEREKLAVKERGILEAEKYLATALEVAEVDSTEDQAHAEPSPSPAPAAPPVAAPVESAPAPAPMPEPIATPAEVPSKEETRPVPDSTPRPSKVEAMQRLGRAIEAWKRARDAGWKVGDIRKTVKSAREAVETGDFEGAILLATEILDQLQAMAVAN